MDIRYFNVYFVDRPGNQRQMVTVTEAMFDKPEETMKAIKKQLSEPACNYRLSYQMTCSWPVVLDPGSLEYKEANNA